MDYFNRYLQLIGVVALAILCFVIGGVTPDEVNIWEEIGKAAITGAVISYFAFMFRKGVETRELSKQEQRLSELLDALEKKVKSE